MSDQPLRIGLIGLGMMGSTHLDIYGGRDDVVIAAISDANPDRLSGKEQAAGNIEGQARGGVDLSDAARFADGLDLIHEAEVDVVDICLPTPLHERFALAAIESDRHVLIEKPLARTSGAAERIVEAAEKSDRAVMPAMCMRFWPGWDWTKKAIDDETYGPVRAASFQRLAPHPGGPFYSNGEACGGALLDLHVHDVDFVQWCFGMPRAVESHGYSKITDHVDHVSTHYHYDDGPLVTAEGGWAMADGFPFTMRFVVNFDSATAVFDVGAEHPLVLCRDGEATPVDLPGGMGYDHEIAYFLDCIRNGRDPETVTCRDAAASVRLAEAEERSVKEGTSVSLG